MEVKESCGIDVLSWFKTSPAESTEMRSLVQDCVVKKFHKEPDFVELINAQVRRTESKPVAAMENSGKGERRNTTKSTKTLIWATIAFTITVALLGIVTRRYHHWLQDRKKKEEFDLRCQGRKHKMR